MRCMPRRPARVDGVFTVDLNAVKHLIGALGALDVPGADEPITRDNIEEQIIRFWEKPVGAGTRSTRDEGEWFAQRKDFIPQIAASAGPGSKWKCELSAHCSTPYRPHWTTARSKGG